MLLNTVRIQVVSSRQEKYGENFGHRSKTLKTTLLDTSTNSQFQLFSSQNPKPAVKKANMTWKDAEHTGEMWLCGSSSSFFVLWKLVTHLCWHLLLFTSWHDKGFCLTIWHVLKLILCSLSQIATKTLSDPSCTEWYSVNQWIKVLHSR